MEQPTSRGFIRSAASWLVTLLCIVAATSSGILLQSFVTHAAAGFAASVFLFIILSAGSIFANIYFQKWLTASSEQYIEDYNERRRLRMSEGMTREKHRLNRICTLADLYIVLLGISILSLCFFSGALDIARYFIPILGFLLLYGLVSRLFQRKPKPDYTQALPEDSYPLLYALVRDAAGLNNRVPLHIFPGSPGPDTECNAGILTLGKHIILDIGPLLLCVCTEEELRQIIRHESAHLSLAHNKSLAHYNRLMNYLTDEQADGIQETFASFVLAFPTAYVMFEGSFFQALSSAAKEIQADSLAAEAGNHVSYASALAKTQAHVLFTFEREIYDNLYRDETPSTDYCTTRLRLFRNRLNEREADWRRIMENELPPRIASHPTFRQRWDALGNCPYSLKPAPDNSVFYEECYAAATEVDRRMRDIDTEFYAELRKVYFLDPLHTTETYEANPVLLPPEEMRPVIAAYLQLGKPEQAEILCDQLIAENSSVFSTAFARFWKGFILLRRYDSAGLELIYQAMETNTNYIEEGLERIGSFCAMMGMEKELEHYRTVSIAYRQKKKDTASAGIHPKSDLTPEQLPEGWLQKIVAYALKNANGNIRQIYLVHENISESYAPSSFILRYRDNIPEEELTRIYDCVFRLLDDWPTEWNFCLYDYEPAMEKALAKVPGACVYDAGKTPSLHIH